MRSIRDPAGRLYFIGSHLIRHIYAEYAPYYRELVLSDFFAELMASGKVVCTSLVENPDAFLDALDKEYDCKSLKFASGDLLLRHDVIPFVSYPSEWPSEMLQAAAELTLDLAEEGFTHGIGLKDATPYNVLFRGARPVFIDVLSFEERDPCDRIWLAQAQFIRTFFLPLLAASHLKLDLSALFVSRRDGVEPHDLYQMLGPLKRLTPAFIGKVSIPVWLSRMAEAQGPSIYKPHRGKSADQARFIIGSMFRGMRRDIKRAGRAVKPSTNSWSDYCRTCTYDERTFGEKSSFVERFLSEARPNRVLDVGCNTGHFSRMAATSGSHVVAIDQDQAVVGALWRTARQEGLDILPLVVNLARPTPALGWNNAETLSFVERSRGAFDAVFMLALIHHLLAGDQIPLPDIFALAARITRRYLLIEYVAPDDPQFRRISRGRDTLYKHLSIDFFEATAAVSFRILQKLETKNHGRCLYLMEKHDAC
jgi:SAM-dependent methyltransferase